MSCIKEAHHASLALITLVTPHYFNAVARSGYVGPRFRRFCSDYGMPITIIAVTGLAYWGRFDTFVLEPNMTLPVTVQSFQAANDRPWLVPFWALPGHYIGIAFPFGFVLFILFYFDSNVSSLIAQGSEFPLRKPSGFHWDFFLLGITTFIAGLLGIPAPNGLIPQAPLHTASLVVLGYEDTSDSSTATAVNTPHGQSLTSGSATPVPEDAHAVQMEAMEQGSAIGPGAGREASTGVKLNETTLRSRLLHSFSAEAKEEKRKQGEELQGKREVPIAVVEQRVSNLAQGALCTSTIRFNHSCCSLQMV
jgi:hypothetical protein